ncbi:MAG: signal peptidase I [Dehalococcoidales bacterium]|nr:MAG: signal peptidase I [Dehalococcoidales bacterium]
MKKKIAGKAVIALLILILVGLGFIYFVPGYGLYLVRSESMAPTINIGDLIITGPVKGEVQEGDIITYEWSGELVTHRVYSTGDILVTKGDAVEDPDPWTVKSSSIMGTYLFKIPYVGYATRFIQTKIGWFITIIVPAMALVVWLAKDIVKETLSNA